MGVVITDVVLRDGLQDEPVFVPPADRLAIAEALVAAGIRDLEAGSFVSPSRVPQMAGADEMVRALPNRHAVRYSFLTLNGRGIRRATAVGADNIHVVVSASAGHSRANAGRNVEAALDDVAMAIAEQPGSRFTAGISTAFVCPFDGEVPAARLVSVARRFAEMGVCRVGLADTLGTATTEHVVRSLRELRNALPDLELSLHLHDAHGQAMRTVDAAIDLGIVHFDSATGGYGGCPFAPGAHGNLATEDLVAHLHQRGIPTGISEPALVAAAEELQRALERAAPVV